MCCTAAGFELVNVDATVIAQRPKLAAYIDNMRANIAAAAGIQASQVSVKATTEEKLGFTGDGSGIAAHGRRADNGEKLSMRRAKLLTALFLALLLTACRSSEQPDAGPSTPTVCAGVSNA